MRARALPFVLAAAAVPLACGGRTALRGGTAGSADASPGADASPQHEDGIVLDNCAPNDAPAYSFQLGHDPVPTCSQPIFGAGSIMISLWEPLPTGPGTFAIASGEVVGGSVALVCATSPSDCTTADHGTITLTEFDPTSDNTASGSYTVVMKDGTTFTGSFSKLVLCHNVMGCG